MSSCHAGLGQSSRKELAFVFYGAEARVAKFGHLFPKAYDLSPPRRQSCAFHAARASDVGELRGGLQISTTLNRLRGGNQIEGPSIAMIRRWSRGSLGCPE